MLQANKAIRDNAVVNIYEMTVDDFNNVKKALEILENEYFHRRIYHHKNTKLINELVNYFHLQGDMGDLYK